MAATATEPLAIPVGTVKSFGPFGPEYEVVAPSEPLGGNPRVRIVLVRTGEETDYGYAAMMLDPEAS